MSKQKFKKGFTLIELMVVIAIIAFLSSVVLASLRDARDRANSIKFKTEMNQFINALELYKSDNGKYPNSEINNYSFNSRLDGNFSFTAGSTDLASTSLLGKYLKKLPKPFTPSTSTSLSWQYRTNTGVISGLNFHYRCENDITTPGYVIFIYTHLNNSNKLISDLFNGLPPGQQGTLFGWSNINLPFGSRILCFSVK